MIKLTSINDKIRGSLIGGAVGDALGYEVEFLSWRSIQQKFGDSGITEYRLRNGKAVISDDTQMTLFTAVGLKNSFENKTNNPINDIYKCYIDWLKLQYSKEITNPSAWISSIPELAVPRAPGNTCLSALRSGVCGSIENPINNSKGCGGIMRIAPIALFYDEQTNIEIPTKLSAEVSAITHGHPLGYIPSAALAYIINTIVYRNYDNFESLVYESLTAVKKMFSDIKYKNSIEYLINLTKYACQLAKNNENDVDNIHKIGGGWVAEETFAIAIYCVLKYETDFDKVMISSVNHSGDSDSAGAVAGNIAGAIIGYQHINQKWKDSLELRDIILQIAN